MIEKLAQRHRELVYSILSNFRQFNDGNAKIIENVVETKGRGIKKTRNRREKDGRINNTKNRRNGEH